MISLGCPCGQKLQVPDNAAGKAAKCPKCTRVVRVPTLQPASGSAVSDVTVGLPSEAGAPSVDPYATKGSAQSGVSGETVSNAVQTSGDPLTAFLAPPEKPEELGRLGGFRILKILGHGGMGVVYLAEDPKLRRKVAIKAMLPDLAQSSSSRQRFLREAQAAAALEHDHIVPILHVGEDRGVPFIVMPFLKGESLDERLKREEPIAVDLIVQVGIEIADALAAAHSQGLLHRDIKPANIWLEHLTQGLSGGLDATPPASRGLCRVKLLDFGLARLAQADGGENLTQSGAILGTPGYMSPEQADGKDLDGRSDLFSLGCVLYRMATDRPAFPGDTITARLIAVVQHMPEAPSRLKPTLPAGLSEIIMQLLEKKRDARPADAREVARRLRALALPTARCAPLPPPEGVSGDGSSATVTLPGPGASEVSPSSPLRPVGDGPGMRGKRPLVLIASLLVGLAAVIALTFGIIRIATPEGDYVIDTDDPDFAFSVSKDKVLLDDKKTKRQYHLKVLKQKGGEYELEVTDAGNDLTFHSKTFTIKRGDKVALKAWFERKVAEAKVEPKVEPKAAPPTFTNSLGMEFVKVPKGTGWLGGGGGKPGDKKVEFEHDFYLGKYEVTQEEWEKVTGLNPNQFSRNGEHKNTVKYISDADLKRFPVENVTWDDCQLLVERLNKQVKETGWVYRLPTAAEWEYACRGGPVDKVDSAFDFYFAKPTNELAPEQANFKIGDKGLLRAGKVGSYLPNRLGLFDMHGNVHEWCADESKDQKGTLQHVFCGGCWDGDSRYCRAAFRYAREASYRSHCHGLRLARVPVVKAIAKIEPLPPDPVEPLPEPPAPTGKPGEVIVDLPPWNLPKDAPKPALAPLTKESAQQVQAAWVKHLKRAAVVQENSVGMKLALVPPGEFDTVYTDPADGRTLVTPESPRRRLRISQPFELGVTEVTVAQFRQFVEETKYQTDAEKSGKGGFVEGGQQKPEWTWKNPGPFKLADTLPVTQVSWNDANAYCEWLNKKEASGAASAPRGRYRLPTEAEWELACRAGSTSFFGVCDKEIELTQHAWVRENGTVGGAQPRPVGNWQANPFGLFDMIGNAWEWCADGGDRGSGERTHAVDPWGYFVYPGVRGPGYDIPAKDAHPAFRRRLTYDHARSNVGFRVLRQLTPEPPPGPLDRPLLVRRNGPLFRDALTQRPTPIPGLRSWSVELAGHGHATRPITAIAWNPKGDVIATGHANDPMVRLWDRQGKLLRVLVGHSSGITSITFSSDGQWLVSVTGWCPARIWNTTTGVCVAVIPSPHTNRPVFSPDGKTLAIQRNSAPIFLQTIDLVTGRLIGSGAGISTPNGDEMIDWSPDSKTIVTADGETGLLNFHSAPYLESMKSAPAFKNARMRVSWSPDGKWLAVSPNDPGEIWIYDAQRREVKLKLNGNQGAVRSFGWSKDSKRLLSGGSNGFIIWDALAGKELLRSTGGGGPVAWSPDETEVAVGSQQRLQIFDAATGLLKRTPPDVGRAESSGHEKVVTSLFSADGKRLFLRRGLRENGPVDIFDPLTGQRLNRWDNVSLGRLIASPANDLLAVYHFEGDKLLILDAATGKQVRELKPHPLPILTVAWSPDGKWLASAGKDKIIRIWNTAEATLKHELPGHEGEIVGLAWSPDGQRLASTSSADKTIRIWDPTKIGAIATYKDFPKDPNPYLGQPAWTADSKSLWVPFQRGMAKLDLTTGHWPETQAFTDAALSMSPDGQCMLVWKGGRPYGFLQSNEQKNDRFLATAFEGGQWHPDSRRILSGFSGVGWLRGYDTQTHQPLGTLVPFIAGDNWLVVGPTGHYAGPKNIEDHLVYVAQTETGEHITLTPAEFEKKYGWKNDAKKASLLATPGKPAPAVGEAAPAVVPFSANEAGRLQAAWAKHLKREPVEENKFGMKFALIPPGEFVMGAPGKEGRASDPLDRKSLPMHTVRLTRPFLMGITEVTQKQFQDVMGYQPSAHCATGERASLVADLKTDDHPVENVSWDEAVQFCNRLSMLEGRKPCYEVIPPKKIPGKDPKSRTPITARYLLGDGYRLPTEAEWEFAARAGEDTRRPSNGKLLSWFGSDHKRTYPVATKQANPFGLHDMLGNVLEWCQDVYGEYPADPQTDPLGPESGPGRVTRGAFITNSASDFVTRAHSHPPTRATFYIGFRVVRNVP